MLPWIHLYTSPKGDVAPCCIAKTMPNEFTHHEPFANSTKDSMMEIMNCTKMKNLRVEMLNDVKNPVCAGCHATDDLSLESFRQNTNRKFGKYFEDAITSTSEDGEISNFKMRYFDIRFSNICNFKCRTCGPDFSSQWEQENIRYNIKPKVIPKNNKKEFLEEVINQIPYMEEAYFAGGEPLITEEHYILLEEMIRQGRTNINLRYNTNLSNLKFKDKDLLSLWKHFTTDVMVFASIDHYGERAEYIRHGTDWATVEDNFRLVKKSPFINLQMNTVLSLYNYKTFLEFYQYLFDKGLYSSIGHTYSIYNMNTPQYMTANILPQHHKEEGKIKILKLLAIMKAYGFDKKVESLRMVNGIIDWTMSPSELTWEKYKEEFRTNTIKRDNIRGESFIKTFPELADLMDD